MSVHFDPTYTLGDKMLSPAQYGPLLDISDQTHADKYRPEGLNYYDLCSRVAGALADNESHRRDIKTSQLQMCFLFAGRIQRSVGSPHKVASHNCFVSGRVEDDSGTIMDMAKEAFMTMRMGGGIGYDFSEIRPEGAIIKSFGSKASGPISFMHIFDATCRTVESAGNRRGAQMAVLRVDHPDIMKFIAAKQGTGELKYFNTSVGITNKFMFAVLDGLDFDLVHDGTVYATVDARNLWNQIMRSTWDWAEPGVLFLDRINEMNNLKYCELISATNPCAEQPLPPYGACLLGSFNIVKYIYKRGEKWFFDFDAFESDIPGIVRAMDNVIDIAHYPLPQQEKEAKDKRRMGLGATGMANALEICGLPYASEGYLAAQDMILATLRNAAYRASIEIAKEKGAFPLFDRDEYCKSEFIKTLPEDIRQDIYEHGIRNSHLLSTAPAGTISLTADNISSGIEPVYEYEVDRTIISEHGPIVHHTTDYAYREYGVRGRIAAEVTPQEHIAVLTHAQKFMDSSVSKTCNVGDEVTWEEFKDIYMTAWENGAKGCTTFRPAGKLMGILKKKEAEVDASGQACYIDQQTGQKECG
jgi:ribonucleoside-diphosphate reductase alpha chain